jgi:hypothetical protein
MQLHCRPDLGVVLHPTAPRSLLRRQTPTENRIVPISPLHYPKPVPSFDLTTIERYSSALRPNSLFDTTVPCTRKGAQEVHGGRAVPLQNATMRETQIRFGMQVSEILRSGIDHGN